MGDKPKPERIAAKESRQQAVLSLRAKGPPKNLDDVFEILKFVQQLERQPKDREGEYLIDAPAKDEQTLAQKSLDSVYDWLSATLEDSKLERHFRYSHGDMTYGSSQFAALRILDAASFLKRYATRGGDGLADGVWKDKIAQIKLDDRYIKSLLGESDAQPTTGDKIANAVVLGFLALPLAAAAVVTIPEIIAAFGTVSFLGAASFVPGGATAIAFVVEHYVMAEVIAYFAVGTFVNIMNAGGIEGFAQQLETPEGAFQTACDIAIFIVQVRGARGGGYVQVRGKVVARKPDSVRIRVESVKEVEPVPVPPPKLGKLNLIGMRNIAPGRTFAIRSTGVPPQDLRQVCAPSIDGARHEFTDRSNCDGHQSHHMANLPRSLNPERVPSPIGGEHCIVEVTHNGKRYMIDSSAKQFVKEPEHPQGIVDIQKIRGLDSKKPLLRLLDALNSGVFTSEQYGEFKKLCGYLP